MKTSLISPVLNEEKNIKKFLDSILKQTTKPNEVLIVDGGSRDKTYEILEEYSKKHKWIKIYKKGGFNIAQGRNYAIQKSKGDIIFTGDSGTKFEKEWVKKILKGFEKNADVVFGTWDIEPSNIVEKFLVSRTPNWNKISLFRFKNRRFFFYVR
jgi:glycosyltransferase involved in cell wall biosynthesis